MFEIPEFGWSDWIDLQGAQVNPQSPKAEGVYRIRDKNSEEILYVGETVNLRRRFSHLQETFKSLIPFADPHTSAPALWAYLQSTSTTLQISFIAVPGNRPKRMSIESTYISILRHQVGQSPLANFGQMPDGWTKSSPNNKTLVDSGKRFRGAADLSVKRVPSMASILDATSSPLSMNWADLLWTPWEEFPNNLPAITVIGLYRVARPNSTTLSYIGKGIISKRLKAHAKKAQTPNHPQASEFNHGFLISWVEMDVAHPGLLELENDLIAGHFLSRGTCPSAQFIG